MARREVCPTDFYCTKARARDRELSIGAIFNIIAAVVRELCVSNKHKMGNFNGLSTRCADDSKVRQGYQ